MKEKDNIEEIILNNLKELNDFEPKEGHLERFQAKLNAQQKKKPFNFSIVWKVAAAVVFVLLAVNQANIYFSPDTKNDALSENSSDFSLASVSPEYKEVEFYYTNAINVEMNQWNSMVADGFISKEEKEMLDKEMADFETRFKNLQADLQANPNDERVINAMLEYYQAKLDIVNLIVNKLLEVKHQKNKTNENNI